LKGNAFDNWVVGQSQAHSNQMCTYVPTHIPGFERQQSVSRSIRGDDEGYYSTIRTWRMSNLCIRRIVSYPRRSPSGQDVTDYCHGYWWAARPKDGGRQIKLTLLHRRKIRDCSLKYWFVGST
jgi:hypothetical protein